MVHDVRSREERRRGGVFVRHEAAQQRVVFDPAAGRLEGRIGGDRQQAFTTGVARETDVVPRDSLDGHEGLRYRKAMRPERPSNKPVGG
jgi:hypothetical protein